ncbi:MAG: DUF599 domain-containing protein [Dongiaceae bacterium]
MALAWFFLVWAGYNLTVDRILRRPMGLNQHLQLLRVLWMRNMIERGEHHRVIDGLLMGQLIQSVAFFASTTMLLLAALIGVMAAFSSNYDAIIGLSSIAAVPRELLELKILLLTGIFIYAFFKFTWALRQYNYCCALIGAAPPLPVPPERRTLLAAQTAEVLSLAVTSFNGGLRAYYFALAVLSWFVHPWLFIAVSTWMLLVLLRRQLRSRTFEAIRTYSRKATQGEEDSRRGPGR